MDLPNKRRKQQLPAASAGETAAAAAATDTTEAAADDSCEGSDNDAAAVAVSAEDRHKIANIYVSAPFEPSDEALARVPPRLLTAVQD